MAQTYNFNGVKLAIPGSYVQTTVINAQSGISANGIVALVGEAESGLAYNDSLSKDLREVAFAPSDLSLVMGLYGSGPIVDAFANMVQPFAEAGLVGGPTKIYILKTNQGSVASRTLMAGTQEVATFSARNVGKFGNNIAVEVIPGDFVEGMRELAFNFQSDQSSDSGSIKGLPVLKFSAATGTNFSIVVGNNTLTITKGTDAVEFDLTGYANIKKLVEQGIGQYTSTGGDLEGLTVVIKNYEYLPCTGIMDTGTYTLVAEGEQFITTYGYQFNAISSDIVAVSAGFAKIVDTDVADWTWQNGGTKLKVNLTGGAKGATTQADIKAALTKIEKLRINFVVPLFSSNDPEGEYTIQQIAADTVAHVVNASKIKANRNRQACLSYWENTQTSNSYKNVKAFVANGAALLNTPYQYRAIMAFQQVQTPDAQQVMRTFEPWMLAAIAAGAQSVAGYRPIFNKALNIAGIYDPQGFDEQYEDALYAGLMPVRLADDTVSQIIVSDQTTYLTPDNNFVYNSFQAVYGSDVIAMTLQQRMQTFVGQSVADVTAGVALNYLKTVLAELLANKWIAPSSDAPAGYKNAKVSINAPVMDVSVEVKESTGIYFVPINLSISAVSSSAQ